MTTGEGLDSMAQSYIDIFGMDGGMDLGVEVIEEHEEVGVEEIVGMDEGGERSVEGID